MLGDVRKGYYLSVNFYPSYIPPNPFCETTPSVTCEVA